MSERISIKMNIGIRIILCTLIYFGLIQSAIAEHFSFITPSSNNTMGFYGDVFTIDGVDSQVGDEIAVFDPQGVFCGHHVLISSGYFNISVYGEDSGLEGDQGAEIGDILTFIIWDSSEDREIPLSNAM
ncbi:hypothetical protein MHK_002663, partial [Candidatus Magnetomorum sp. HK-1]